MAASTTVVTSQGKARPPALSGLSARNVRPLLLSPALPLPKLPSKETLLAAENIAHAICAPVPHWQLVFTIPKRLRTVREEKGVEYAIEYAGYVSEKYIRRYTMPSQQETGSALEKLFG